MPIIADPEAHMVGRGIRKLYQEYQNLFFTHFINLYKADNPSATTIEVRRAFYARYCEKVIMGLDPTTGEGK